jgi:flagellar M-ring protein FliF
VYSKQAPPVSSQSTTETYSGGKNGSGGTLGTTQAGNGVTVGSGGNYRKTTALVNNALGTQTKTTETAPGGVTKMSVAVLLDKSAKNVSIPAVTSLVTAALGLQQQRGDTLQVQAIPFDNTAANAAAAQTALAAKTAASQQAHQALLSMIKQGALGGLILAVVLGTWLRSRRRKPQPAPDVPVDELFAAQDEPAEPAPAAEPAQPLAPVTNLQDAAARRRALMEVAERKPDDAAKLLSSWLRSREG